MDERFQIVGAAYPWIRLQKAAATADAHVDPATRDRARAKVEQARLTALQAGGGDTERERMNPCLLSDVGQHRIRIDLPEDGAIAVIVWPPPSTSSPHWMPT